MKMFKKDISKEEINDFPLVKFEGKIHIVESLSDQDRIARVLRKENHLGFDTETKPTFKKGNKNEVALIQLATLREAYLLRVSKSGLSDSLIDLFEDNRVDKLGVAIRDDLKDLKRFRTFDPQGFHGLEKLVKQVGIESNGLKKLAGIILGIKISKSAQVSNWEAEKLTEKQLNYAATDAWVCLKMFTELKEKGWPMLEDNDK